MLKLIQPMSKKDQVVAAMKDAMLAGTIAPGEAIVESRIAKELGTGIPLVREALIELEHEGWVQKTRYKGTTVTKLGPKEIQQIFKIRIELETLAIGWAHEHVTEADINELQELIKRMERAAAELDLDQFYECDLAMHRKIWDLTDNRYLADALERVVVPLFAFFVMKTKRERDSYLASAAEHARIVDRLRDGSVEELRDLMRESLTGWQADMHDLLF